MNTPICAPGSRSRTVVEGIYFCVAVAFFVYLFNYYLTTEGGPTLLQEGLGIEAVGGIDVLQASGHRHVAVGVEGEVGSPISGGEGVVGGRRDPLGPRLLDDAKTQRPDGDHVSSDRRR